jgi:hypothetical protein
MMMRVGFRILVIIVLLAGLIGLGAYTYNLGVTRGAMQSALASQSNEGAAPLVYPPYAYPGFFHGWGFGHGWGFFGLILPLLFGLFLFGLIGRLIFFGFARRSWGHWGGSRHWGHAPEHWQGEVPPFMAELHRKLHEQEAKGQVPPEHKAE